MNPTQALEKLRSRGWSDRKIARAVGVSPNTIGRIRTNPDRSAYDTGKKVITLAAAIDLPALKEMA